MELRIPSRLTWLGMASSILNHVALKSDEFLGDEAAKQTKARIRRKRLIGSTAKL